MGKNPALVTLLEIQWILLAVICQSSPKWQLGGGDIVMNKTVRVPALTDLKFYLRHKGTGKSKHAEYQVGNLCSEKNKAWAWGGQGPLPVRRWHVSRDLSKEGQSLSSPWGMCQAGRRTSAGTLGGAEQGRRRRTRRRRSEQRGTGPGAGAALGAAGQPLILRVLGMRRIWRLPAHTPFSFLGPVIRFIFIIWASLIICTFSHHYYPSLKNHALNLFSLNSSQSSPSLDSLVKIFWVSASCY